MCILANATNRPDHINKNIKQNTNVRKALYLRRKGETKTEPN